MKIIIFITFLFLLTSHAEEKFQPYMIGHSTKGCPENSYCNQKLAKKHMRWINVLNGLSKNKYRDLNNAKAKYGAPVNFYHASADPNKAEHILWDSRCKNHKKAPTRIYEARDYYKKLPIKDVDENSFFTYILIEKPNQIQRITISRGDFPLFYEDDAVYINREEEGNYYGVVIKASGDYAITDPIETKLAPQEVKCPDHLMTKLRSLISNKSVFSSAICRKIWDRKNQVFYTYVIGDACF